MKLRITVGAEDKLNGYTNVDPVSQFDGLNADLRNLDAIVSDAESSEILADEVIDFIRQEEVYPILDHWINKLRHNGNIFISLINWMSTKPKSMITLKPSLNLARKDFRED